MSSPATLQVAIRGTRHAASPAFRTRGDTRKCRRVNPTAQTKPRFRFELRGRTGASDPAPQRGKGMSE